MPKLPRVTAKIFANNAALEDIGQYGSALLGSKVNTNNISEIQALPAYETGWRGAVISDRNYPTLQEMNGLQKTFSQQIAYLLQSGMPEWDNGTEYYKNQFCKVDLTFYYSLTDNNIGNNPETSTDNWAKWNPSEGDFANIDLSNLSPSGQGILDNKLNKQQITNCILSTEGAPSITSQKYANTAYVNHGCTITDNTASGFSESNYILLNKTFTSSTVFNFEFPVNLTDVMGTQVFFAINNFDNSVGINNGVLFFRYNGEQINGDVQLPINTDIVVKLTRTVSSYTLSYKTTGDYQTEITLPSRVGYFGGKSIYIGSRGGYYLKGNVNLASLIITEDSTDYWTNNTLLDFQTVDIQANLNLLMPDGKNSNGTLKNIEKTIDINDTLLYTPVGAQKTILVKQDGELMIRDYYLESYTEPLQTALNGVWFDKNANILYEQLATYPNFINTGAAINDGIVTINSAAGYIQLPSSYDLGENWSISLPINIQPGSQGVVIGEMEVNNEAVNTYLPDGIGVYYDGTNLNAYFRRNDVYQVQKDAVIVGYVKIPGFNSTLVPVDTTVYTDVNCTTTQATATGNDYIFTGVTSPSLIGSLSVPYTGSSDETISLSYNGEQYLFNTQALVSTDIIRQNATITLGGTSKTVSTNILGTINLNTAVFSFWEWNGVSDNSSDFILFVGARIGAAEDDGTDITNTYINNPVELAQAEYSADTNLSNVSDSGREFIAAQGMPDCKYGKIYPKATWRTVDTPCLVSAVFDNGNIIIELKDENGKYIPVSANLSDGGIARMTGNSSGVWCFVPKGYSYRVVGSHTFYDPAEYPLKGTL